MEFWNPRILVLSIVAMALLTVTASSQETLRWKFKKGQKLYYEKTQKRDISSMVAGTAVDTKTTNIMDVDWIVKSVKADGTAEIVQKISRIQMTMTGGPVGKIEFDSNKKDGGGAAIAKSLAGLVNAEMTLTMTSTGKIENLKLSEKTKAALEKIGAQGGTGGGGISEDTFRQMSSQMGAIFPVEAVSKGKSWPRTFEFNDPAGKMKADTTFNYLGIESKGVSRIAKIEMKQKTFYTLKADTPQKMTIKDKGSIGTSYFDLSAGLLINSTATQNMDVEMTTNGIQVVSAIKTVTDFKLKK